MNRLLLQGARYHERRSLFVSADWGEMPDWRADRHSIRIALALRERHGVGPGDVVALGIPFSARFVLAERAIWGLGASTLPLPQRGVRWKATIASESECDALLEEGGVLDTPERAASFRAFAREVPATAIASIESGRELRHQDWVRKVGSYLERSGSGERGRRERVPRGEALLPSRVAVYGCWAEGLATVEFC
jgi:acyl-CoA synthetase (AMP-forming)/AMP-acid ligase II